MRRYKNFLRFFHCMLELQNAYEEYISICHGCVYDQTHFHKRIFSNNYKVSIIRYSVCNDLYPFL